MEKPGFLCLRPYPMFDERESANRICFKRVQRICFDARYRNNSGKMKKMAEASSAEPPFDFRCVVEVGLVTRNCHVVVSEPLPKNAAEHAPTSCQSNIVKTGVVGEFRNEGGTWEKIV